MYNVENEVCLHCELLSGQSAFERKLPLPTGTNWSIKQTAALTSPFLWVDECRK